jgi:hypothetical protein
VVTSCPSCVRACGSCLLARAIMRRHVDAGIRRHVAPQSRFLMALHTPALLNLLISVGNDVRSYVAVALRAFSCKADIRNQGAAFNLEVGEDAPSVCAEIRGCVLPQLRACV